MKKTRKAIAGLLLGVILGLSTPAHAGMPVFDGARLVQEIIQVLDWVEQLSDMVDNYNKMVSTYDSLNGIRDMASLVNNPGLRKYLPDDVNQIIEDGYGDWETIRNANIKLDILSTTIDPASELGIEFLARQKQLANNQATIKDAYSKAATRFDDIQVLLDKVNHAPDAKDMEDLKGRIGAEAVEMQNEEIKLSMLTQMQKASRKAQNQRSSALTGIEPLLLMKTEPVSAQQGVS